MPYKENRPIYPSVLAGLNVRLYQPTETQLALMGRFALKAQGQAIAKDGMASLHSISKVFDILESLVVEEADKETILDLLGQGKLDLEDVMSALRSTAPELEPTNGPVPRVTRGRPRK